jgi:7-carboxy-7-deazaguanine synthase
MTDNLTIHEIYLSVQGESTFAGLPCVFVRLTACNLRCSYCDTAYAFTGGQEMTPQAVRERVHALAEPYRGLVHTGHRMPLIEFTGGEPLLQKAAPAVMKALCDEGFTVLVETSGNRDISILDPRVRRIMDLKCPSSGESGKNLWANLRHLKATDEVKFVIGTVEDYEWAKLQIRQHRLAETCSVLFSWVHPLAAGQQDPALKPVPEGQTPISRRELVERVIADALPVRFQAQLHKIVWPPDQKGV